MYILDPALDDARWDEDIEGVKNVISSKGGEVKEVQKWGRRRLAYEIARQNEGYYVVLPFSSEPDAVLELDRVLSLADEVLRFKVVLRKAA